MLIHQPSLVEQVSHLRTAVRETEAPYWLPDAVHVLIMACLARIFGRLEQMILLWQAGHLPPLPAPRPRLAARPRRDSSHPRAPRHHARRTRQAPADLRADVATPARRTTHRRAPANATTNGIARAAPPHPARAPPPSLP